VNVRNPYLVPVAVAALVSSLALGGFVWFLADGDPDRASGAPTPESIEREWAASACGSVNAWWSEIRSSADSVRDDFSIADPGGTWDLIRAEFDDARSATDALIADLSELEAPDTPNGRALAAGLDELVDHAGEHGRDVAVRLGMLGTDLDLLDGLGVPALIDELRDFYRDLRADLEALGPPASQMLDVLRATDSCTPILSLLQLT
jgi:hypothetical protein